MAESLPEPPLSILDGAALFLDFDGTLVELAEAPGEIDVPADLPRLLDRLAERLQGRVAIVSGRSVGDLERHAGALGVAVAGTHGLELQLPGQIAEALPPRPGLDGPRRAIEAFARAHQGLLVEEKPGGIALHFRQAQHLAGPVAELMQGLAQASGLRLQHGKMVAELLPEGADKGEAVRRLMAAAPFAGARPVVLGDDLTDEHGFEAAAAMGGVGVLVGAARDTAARYRLPDVRAVRRWLAEAARG